jgi:HNH endonuclease
MNSNNTIIFPPAGRCIYCGQSEGELTTEHIVPYSLGGRFLLPEASCANCQVITALFERSVARRSLLVPRTVSGFPTRRPNNRASHITVKFTRHDGTKFKKKVSVDIAPLVNVVPHFAADEFADRTDAVIHSKCTLQALDHIQNDSRRRELREKEGVRSTTVASGSVVVSDWVRLLWKIALGFFWVSPIEKNVLTECASFVIDADNIQRFNHPLRPDNPYEFKNIISKTRAAPSTIYSKATVYTLAEEEHLFAYCEIDLLGILSFPLYVCRISNPNKAAIPSTVFTGE